MCPSSRAMASSIGFRAGCLIPAETTLPPLIRTAADKLSFEEKPSPLGRVTPFKGQLSGFFNSLISFRHTPVSVLAAGVADRPPEIDRKDFFRLSAGAI